MKGAKPKNLAFSACPRMFHKCLALFESELKLKKDGTTQPKTWAEQWMADCFDLSVETVKDAKRGRGPYALGKCKVAGCEGGAACLLEKDKFFEPPPC
jgi:hypothetical protein